MEWKAHLLFGCVCGAIVSYWVFGLGFGEAALFSAISGLSALAPDLDMRKSRASKLLYGAVLLLLLAIFAVLFFRMGLFAALAGTGGVGASLVLADFLFRPRHRGVMHGLLFMLFCFGAMWVFFGSEISAAFLTGFLSHLLLDGCLHL